MAEVSGDLPKGRRMSPAMCRKRVRPQVVNTLIATAERFTDQGNAPRMDIGGFDELTTRLKVERFRTSEKWPRLHNGAKSGRKSTFVDAF